MFNILSHFSLFPQLTAVDDVLPQYIRSRPHRRQRIQIRIRHPNGKNCVFLPQRLPATDTIIVVSANFFSQIELNTAGYQTGQSNQDFHKNRSVAIRQRTHSLPRHNGKRHCPQIESGIVEFKQIPMHLFDKHPQKPCNKKGRSNNGNTLLNIFRKAAKKVILACGSTQGNTNGTATAAKRLDNNV